MPKVVDHELRREQISDALMRVAAKHGLEAASLRQVAAEAGVSVGMVQHYFPSRHLMIVFAMMKVRDDLRVRMTARALDHTPRALARALLAEMLTPEVGGRELRIILAFLAYSAVHPDAADELRTRSLASQARLTRIIRDHGCAVDAERATVTLFALIEGLALHVHMGGCPPEAAASALEVQLDVLFGPELAPARIAR